MRKVELTGILYLTNDLASRLQSRGLLSSSGESTEELILYIQECLARDDSRCSILAENIISDRPLPSAEAINDNKECDLTNDSLTTVTEAQEPKSSSLMGSLSSLVDESDLDALRQGLSTLYKGG